jgi:hypothetical protein
MVREHVKMQEPLCGISCSWPVPFMEQVPRISYNLFGVMKSNVRPFVLHAKDHRQHTSMPPRVPWRLIGRAIWAGLFLIHLVPLVSVGSRFAASPGLNLFLSLAAIVAVMTIALLKAIDVRALQFQFSFQKWCTLIVLGLFFHGDVVAKQLPDFMVVESTIVVLVSIVCASRRLRNIVMSVSVDGILQIRESLYAWIEELAPTPLIPAYALLTSPRPPPVS